MQILHLHWLTPTRPEQHGRFLLWVETTATNPPSRNRRKKSAQPHPFAADRDGLRALLSAIRWRGKLPVNKLTLWLPTNHFGPVPSPELLPWEIIGGTLDAAQTMSLLTWLHQNELTPTIRLGVDGRYWQTTFSFILELLARQLYRPALVEVREKRELRFVCFRIFTYQNFACDSTIVQA